MWIVRLALRRPYTFVVMALLIAIFGIVTLVRIPTDIFPEIDIPVVAVIFNYTGIPPEEMETRIVGNFERALVSTVSEIEHIESQSLYGVSVTKVFLQPGAKVEAAVAQITAVGQVVTRQMPPGTFPPFIMRYSATNVPIVQISLSSDVLSEQQVFDIATTGLKPGLATVRGVQMPYPYGGKQRQIMVDLDPERLYAHGISPSEVSAAIGAQNLILPAGTAKIGANEYQIRLNSSPETVAELNDLPIKTAGGTTVYVRDVAWVRDGFSPQTNIVNVDGKRGVVQSVLKAGASTLEIVDSLKERLPAVLTTLPKDLKAALLADQSTFVRAAIDGVVVEAVMAAALTGLMILLFLGSWRSTVVVVTSIPLSILVSMIVLHALGHSMNVMTLGGMALAVGILVDDATVEIENIHRNLHQRKPLLQAILDGARQIAVPAFVSTLCICIVFIPVWYIDGAARSLFVPLALAVVFAMLTSYVLSRTLVPTMVRYLLRKEVPIYHGLATGGGIIWAVHRAFDRGFERLRTAYGSALSWVLEHRLVSASAFAVLFGVSAAIFPMIGRDFFPGVDAGQLRLHVRAPHGTRIEETERCFGEVEQVVRGVIPKDEIQSVIQNMGIPYSGINLALSDGSQMSPAEGELLVSFSKKRTRPTPEYAAELRGILAEKFPDLTFFFQPPDMVTQVLNFGLPAPIDVQIVGPRGNLDENAKIAKRLAEEIALIPGAVDVHLQQVVDTPEIRIDVDRTMASQLGLTQREIASDALISLSSSGQASPNFWTEPASGVQYPVAVQTPQYRIDSVAALASLPSSNAGLSQPQLLGNLAGIRRGAGRTNATHYNLSPTFDVLASVHGTDLASVAKGVEAILARVRPTLPRGTSITVRGQVADMNASFRTLSYGLVLAVLLVYLLMVINFQSWLEPFIILMALPGALSGIVWMLFVTGTTVSVPALMGAIMSIGVATSNSILMVTFANEQQRAGRSAVDAAWSAGVTRLRPVIMTALAMIIGMLPMSLGLSEGGEQNAPLGRAVIGGLIAATAATLFFVPIVFSVLRRRAPAHAPAAEEALLA
jgi:CzcA family heavy metal efflux pump